MRKQIQKDKEKKENSVQITPEPDFPDMWYRRNLTEGIKIPKSLQEQGKGYDKKLQDIQQGKRAVTPRQAICDICMCEEAYRIYDTFIDRGRTYAYGIQLGIPYDQKQNAVLFRIAEQNKFRPISEQQQKQMLQVYAWEYRLMDVIPRCVRHLLWDKVDKIQMNLYMAERNHSYTVPEISGWLPRPFPHGKAHVTIQNTCNPVVVRKGNAVGPSSRIHTPLDGYMVADIVGLTEIRDTFVALAYQKQTEKEIPLCEKPVYFLFERDKKQKLHISKIENRDLSFYMEECGLLERFALVMTQMQDLEVLYI